MKKKEAAHCDDRDTDRNYGRTCLAMFPKNPHHWCEACQIRHKEGRKHVRGNTG